MKIDETFALVKFILWILDSTTVKGSRHKNQSHDMRHGLSFKNINTYTKNVKYSLTGFLESSSVNQVGDWAKKFQASLSLFFYDDHPSRFNSSWIPTLTTLAVILFSRRRSAMNGERKLFYWNRSKTWTLSQLIHQNHLKIAVGVDKSSYSSSSTPLFGVNSAGALPEHFSCHAQCECVARH